MTNVCKNSGGPRCDALKKCYSSNNMCGFQKSMGLSRMWDAYLGEKCVEGQKMAKKMYFSLYISIFM